CGPAAQIQVANEACTAAEERAQMEAEGQAAEAQAKAAAKERALAMEIELESLWQTIKEMKSLRK
ncbi:hypothetical protein FRC06_001746, partial [Ceratobasidium sp. 370]